MNIDVLLTDKEWREVRYNKCFDGATFNMDNLVSELCKAQAIKLLEWLVKERLVAHENYSEFKDYEKNFKNWHRPDCRVCELESKLKEG